MIQSTTGQMLVTYKSDFSFEETFDRVLNTIRSKEMEVVDIVTYNDYTEEEQAKSKVIFYQNPYVVTLTECDQTAALDIPLRMIVWREDEDVFIGYLDPTGLQRKYLLDACKYTIEWITKLNLRIISESLKKTSDVSIDGSGH